MTYRERPEARPSAHPGEKPEKPSPAGSLALGFQPSDCEELDFCGRAHSLRYFAMTGLEK